LFSKVLVIGRIWWRRRHLIVPVTRMLVNAGVLLALPTFW